MHANFSSLIYGDAWPHRVIYALAGLLFASQVAFTPARGEPIGGTTVAPALESASVDNVRGPSSPTCVRSQNTNATQTANEFFASLNIKGVLYSDKDGVFFDGIAVTPDGKTLCGIVQFKKTWEEFWDNAESQDLLHSYTVEYVVGLPGSPLNPNTRAVTGTVMVIATLAPSRLNTDYALLIAAAKSTADPTKTVWHRHRIQLTHVADNGHFCTPSSTAAVLAPKIGVSTAGRVFITFDSFFNSTTTGSILDFDIQSLFGAGDPKLKCFKSTAYAGLVPPDVRDSNAMAYFLGVKDLATVKRYKLTVGATPNDDVLTPTANVTVPGFDFNPAAVQPNGSHLFDGGFEFRNRSIQIGTALWNVQVIGDSGAHAKVRLYKIGTTGTSPKMTLTLGTRTDHADDLIAPSFDILGTEAFITFTRTVSSVPTTGNATLMMARGPNSSTSGWTSMVLRRSPGQFSKNVFGSPCDPFVFAGCMYVSSSSTFVDQRLGQIWGFGEIITDGTLGTGGAGNEVNWMIQGFAVPQ